MITMLSTAELFDAHPHCASCETQFKQYGGRRRFFGRIRTVRCKDDNVLMRRLLETKTTDEVLVVDGGGYLGSALIGDMTAGIAADNGWAGVLIYGALRDVLAIETLDIGVKALGSNPRKSGKAGTGESDVILSFSGAIFTPGHWLYSDDDGLLISPKRLPEL